MLKKVLCITGLIFAGLNLGMISGVAPVFLIIGLVAFADGLEANIVAGFSTFAALIYGLVAYIYIYGKKREHEAVNVYVSVFHWSLFAGAVIAAIALFVYSAGEVYRI